MDKTTRNLRIIKITMTTLNTKGCCSDIALLILLRRLAIDRPVSKWISHLFHATSTEFFIVIIIIIIIVTRSPNALPLAISIIHVWVPDRCGVPFPLWSYVWMRAMWFGCLDMPILDLSIMLIVEFFKFLLGNLLPVDTSTMPFMEQGFKLVICMYSSHHWDFWIQCWMANLQSWPNNAWQHCANMFWALSVPVICPVVCI